ncbi:MAG: hypothetical protein HRU38_16490 [Saccharospirillaceae bacterium]|nr:hypothetical protein [Saccharospirillaceae bacterium]
MLPLIDVFPIKEREPTLRELLFVDGRTARLEANNPLDFCLKQAKEYQDNRLPNALEMALNNSSSYNHAKSLMPNISDVSPIYIYRNDFKVHDGTLVNHELNLHGKMLSPGQVLFHGGDWPLNNGVPIAGGCFQLNKVLSTSLSPQVATTHALYHPSGWLWIINVLDSSNTKAFVFNNVGENLAHELEVLLTFGGTITCTSTHVTGGINILEATLSH